MFFDRISFTSPSFSSASPGILVSQFDFRRLKLFVIGNGFNVGGMLVDAFIEIFPALKDKVRHIICRADYQVAIQGIIIEDFHGLDKITMEETLLKRIDDIGRNEGIIDTCSIEGEYYINSPETGCKNVGYRIQYCPCIDRQ